jgi:hypothetical protein
MINTEIKYVIDIFDTMHHDGQYESKSKENILGSSSYTQLFIYRAVD